MKKVSESIRLPSRVMEATLEKAPHRVNVETWKWEPYLGRNEMQSWPKNRLFTRSTPGSGWKNSAGSAACPDSRFGSDAEWIISPLMVLTQSG